MPFNANAFYKVVLNASYAGQTINNILYYRIGLDTVPGDFNFGGAEDLAFQVKAEIWTAALQPAMGGGYYLESITVYPLDNTFSPIYQTPYTLAVGESGGRGAAASNGPAPCANIRFNLEPTTILNGLVPPHFGYVAVGPLLDGDVNNSGTIEEPGLGLLQTVGDAMASNLENATPFIVFFPIRWRTVRVAGVVTVTGWADVASASVRSVASFRRSRVPEG